MPIAIVKSAVTIGLALALTATTCSVAKSGARPGTANRVAQYCAPPHSWEVPRLFCGLGKSWDVIEPGHRVARIASEQTRLASTAAA